MHKRFYLGLFAAASLGATAHAATPSGLKLSANDTLEMQGLSVIVEQNHFSPIFFDEKNSGIQIVLHGERIAADGEVRLNPTPEQWAPVPAFVSRVHGKAPGQLIVSSTYEAVGLKYTVEVTPEGQGFKVVVNLDKPLSPDLVGKAGFNLDFLPTAYFGKTYILDAKPGLFPRDASGPMNTDGSGDPLPLASGGKSITLSPEDPLTRVTITSDAGPVMLYDARNRAQNGWFVVRSLIAAGAKDRAIVWHVQPHVEKGWVRDPVVSFNQAGYTPDRSKVALFELDPNFKAPAQASLVRLTAGGAQTVLRAKVTSRGKWTRYNYAAFDFSSVKTPGVYAISYAGKTTNPFPIAPDAYAHIWQASLDTYLAEQMDHMAVREQYRVWTGISHMDDARQAPANTVHFDGYHMGAELDSPFKAGEHIPGLNVGGWQDAGDYDIQTPQNAQVVRDLALSREMFGLDWDETTVDEAAHSVQIRKPDGVQDSVQQIRHGVLQLLAQYKVFGHAITGIIDPTLGQYTDLGDSGSQTDRMIYDPKMGPLDNNGVSSGVPDDRWAFTTDSAANDYTVAGALASASRQLADSDPALAAEALTAAKTMWANQQDPGERKNRAGRDEGPGWFDFAAVQATVDLILTTKGDALYTAKLKTLMPVIQARFTELGGTAVLAIPYMDADYRAQLAAAAKAEKAKIDAGLNGNPFGVPVDMGGWAGSDQVALFGSNMYLLHKAFPEIIGTGYTLDALDYMLGRHPASNLSLVSTVGTRSKLVAYGHNRADYSFVPGGMVPGVLVIKPDFPEQKEDWPFLWFENEYTASTTADYIVAANAAIAVTKETVGK